MYAVIQLGSKQYMVRKGDKILVDLFDCEAEKEVDIEKVLLISDEAGKVEMGAPVIAGNRVKARYIAEAKGPKITSVKYKRRKNQYRKFGHRQKYIQLEITEIQG